MRRVTAPDGRDWRVGRQWLPARVRLRRSKDASDASVDDDGGLLDGIGDFFGMDDAGVGILIGFAVLAVAALLLVVVFPILALTIELLLLLVLFFAGIVGRVVFRRPWHVVARTSRGTGYRWPVRGWRASGAKVQEVAAALASGHTPSGAEVLER